MQEKEGGAECLVISQRLLSPVVYSMSYTSHSFSGLYFMLPCRVVTWPHAGQSKMSEVLVMILILPLTSQHFASG